MYTIGIVGSFVGWAVSSTCVGFGDVEVGVVGVVGDVGDVGDVV